MALYQQQLTALSRLAYQSDQLYRQWARQQGINYHQLITLYELYNQGQCTQNDIVKIWRVPKQTIHTVCNQFAKDNMIIGVPDSEDGREHVIRLTEAGRRFATPIVEQMVALEGRITRQLDHGALQQTIATIDKFNTLFEEELKK